VARLRPVPGSSSAQAQPSCSTRPGALSERTVGCRRIAKRRKPHGWAAFHHAMKAASRSISRRETVQSHARPRQFSDGSSWIPPARYGPHRPGPEHPCLWPACCLPGHRRHHHQGGPAVAPASRDALQRMGPRQSPLARGRACFDAIERKRRGVIERRQIGPAAGSSFSHQAAGKPANVVQPATAGMAAKLTRPICSQVTGHQARHDHGTNARPQDQGCGTAAQARGVGPFTTRNPAQSEAQRQWAAAVGSRSAAPVVLLARVAGPQHAAGGPPA